MITIKAEVPDEQLRRVIDTYLIGKANLEEEILTTAEACDYLRITPQTLNKKANCGEIKFFEKPGVRPKLFLKSELNKYLKK